MDKFCTDYLADRNTEEANVNLSFPYDHQIIDHISFICNVPRTLGCETEWYPKL